MVHKNKRQNKTYTQTVWVQHINATNELVWTIAWSKMKRLKERKPF